MSVNSTDITKALRIPTQIPLDTKTWVAQKTDISTLGTGNNLAFTYYDGLTIYCADTKESFRWKEALAPGGLLISDFTYPANTIINGFDYSGKAYNLYQVSNALEIDEGLLVHKSGNETIAGFKTFTNTVIVEDINASADINANAFVVNTYTTGNELLKADGTLDSTDYAAEADVVHKTGNEVIAGIKTFNSTILANDINVTNDVFAAAFVNANAVTGNELLKSDGTLDSNTYALDSTVVHKTGDESISGEKTFNNTAINAVKIINPADGAGLFVSNTLDGIGVDLFNGNVGTGIVVTNSSTGVGLQAVNFSTGQGLLVDNGGAGNGATVNNVGTGFSYVGQNNAVNTFTVSKAGDIVANKFTKTGGLSTEFLMADGSVSAGGGVDTTAVHKTGNETIVGTKTFNKTGTTSNIIVNNTAAGFGLEVNNNASGRGIIITNDSVGEGIRINNESEGEGLVINNSNLDSAAGLRVSTATGPGILIQANNNSAGLDMTVSNTAFGILMSNGGTGLGIDVENFSSGTGIYSASNTTGHNFVANNVGTGFNYIGQNNAVNTFTVDKVGKVVAESLNISALNTAPATATSTGTTGEIRWTATHVYLCTATDTWVRAALATF